MDRWLLQALNHQLGSSRLDDLMVLLSTAGLVLLPGFGVWMLIQRRYRRVAVVLLAGLAATLALTLLFQELVMRPRPPDVRLILPAPDYHAYPSGHAALAFCTAALLSLTYRRRWIIAVSLLGATLIALSRVYLGHHYPSDVVGGAVLGAGVGALFYGIWLGDRPRLRWGIWPQLSLVVIITHLAYLGLLPRGWDLGLPYADKLLHFLLFGLLAFWLHLWWRGRWISFVRRVRAPLAALVVLGGAALEELAQALSPNRSADPIDLLCDLAGVVLFIWCAGRLLRRGEEPNPGNLAATKQG